MTVIAILLLAVGLTILGVPFYLRRKSLRAMKVLDQLYQLNQSVNQDPLVFLDQAWSELAQMPFFGLKAAINWFGVHQLKEFGIDKGEKHKFDLQVGEMAITLTFFRHKVSGEQLWLLNLVQRAFVTLLHFDMSAKQTEINTSTERLKQLSLFLQHDMKNIAQFIQLLEEEIKEAQTPEEKQQLVDFLHSVVPAMRLRADRTLHRLLKAKKSMDKEEPLVSCVDTLHNLAERLQVPVAIEAKADGQVPQSLMTLVADYVLDDFNKHAHGQKVQVKIHAAERGEQLVLHFSASGQAQKAPVPLRAFEPFWSTSSSGMGLGLYLVKTLLDEVGGSLQLDEEGGFKLLIHLPAQVKIYKDS